ncbi:trypsin, partial [Klebsiella oxytoca]
MATLFAQNTQANASQEKNFIVKLIYWLDWLGEGWLFRWDGKEAVKIVAENVVKKQEYFFYYLLTLLGMDVLLLQSRQDI